LIVTGGLGCAPVASVINSITSRRERFGRLTIMQGVKHSDDRCGVSAISIWSQMPDSHVIIAADQGGQQWSWRVGPVIDIFDELALQPDKTIAMMCGPEGMMHAAIRRLHEMGVPEEMLFMSMERNMQCAVGHCGHCQYGGQFVCKDGPVFSFNEIKDIFGVAGF